jgi:hypothetical protein
MSELTSVSWLLHSAIQQSTLYRSKHKLFDSTSDTGLFALVKMYAAQANFFSCNSANQGYIGAIDFAYSLAAGLAK